MPTSENWARCLSKRRPSRRRLFNLVRRPEKSAAPNGNENVGRSVDLKDAPKGAKGAALSAVKNGALRGGRNVAQKDAKTVVQTVVQSAVKNGASKDAKSVALNVEKTGAPNAGRIAAKCAGPNAERIAAKSAGLKEDKTAAKCAGKFGATPIGMAAAISVIMIGAGRATPIIKAGAINGARIGVFIAQTATGEPVSARAGRMAIIPPAMAGSSIMTAMIR